MWQQAIAISTGLVVVFALWVVTQITFLRPYRSLYLARHGDAMMWFIGMMWLTLVAIYVVIASLVKGSGFTLRTAEKDLQEGDIMPELAKRLSAEE